MTYLLLSDVDDSDSNNVTRAAGTRKAEADLKSRVPRGTA
jgi:hypothetical protein